MSFVLQGIYGLSLQGYSFAFGLNSLGLMIFGFLGGRLAVRWNERVILVIALAMALAGSLGLLTTALLHLPLISVILSLFSMAAVWRRRARPRLRWLCGAVRTLPALPRRCSGWPGSPSAASRHRWWASPGPTMRCRLAFSLSLLSRRQWPALGLFGHIRRVGDARRRCVPASFFGVGLLHVLVPQLSECDDPTFLSAFCRARSRARYTVDRPTENSSASSYMVCSPAS